MAKKRLCILIEEGLGYPVALKQQGKSFIVEYGEHVRRGMSYEEAPKDLGICIMHSLACVGNLDNE